ncbi:MAG: LysR family transcriptional regulator [Saprospiraceae bacterium]|nr:LysR family transcriptional regulator [Saprospiraceae bacterium]
MEIRQLIYFITIASEKQFVKAAARLFVSQSALSQQIAHLESELGVDLFNKVKRKKNRVVELTEAGEIFLKDAKKIVDLAQKAKEKAANFQKSKSELKLGSYRMIHNQRIIDTIDILSSKYPDALFKLEEYETHLDVQEAILSGNIDFGISVGPLISAELDSLPLLNSELRILMYESHPLAQKESLVLSQLGAEDWVEIKAEVHPIYQVIEAFCKKAGFERSGKIVQEVSSLELMCHFVGLKKGIAFVPSFFDTSSFPNVIKKKLQGEQLIFDQCMVFLKGRME